MMKNKGLMPRVAVGVEKGAGLDQLHDVFKFPWHKSRRRTTAWGGFVHQLDGTKPILLKAYPVAYLLKPGDYLFVWGELWGRTSKATASLMSVSQQITFRGIAEMPSWYCDELALQLENFLRGREILPIDLSPAEAREIAKKAVDAGGPLPYEFDYAEQRIKDYIFASGDTYVNNMLRRLGLRKSISILPKISRLTIHGYVGFYVCPDGMKMLAPRVYG